ncbi:hypothetical protein ACHAW6_011992 [Cyclotella cf. meneghiniana]
MNETNGALSQSSLFPVRGRATNWNTWQGGCMIGDHANGALPVSASGASASNDMIARGHDQSLPPREFRQVQSEEEHASGVALRHDQEIFYDRSKRRGDMSKCIPSRLTGVTYEDIICYMNAVDALTMSRFGVTHRELMEIKAETEREMAMVSASRESGYSRAARPSSFSNGMNLSNIDSPSEGELAKVSTAVYETPTIQRHEKSADLEEEQGRSRSDSGLLCSDEVPTVSNGTCQMGRRRRWRRACAVAGCPNGVVQGGVCISHGAIRKTCNVPGCTKPVKKYGKCSAHGPERQKCNAEGCTKVSVRGGKCHSHGAKRRSCAMEGCPKQPTVGDMCKHHYNSLHGIQKARKSRKRKVSDSEGGEVKNEDQICVPLEKNV